MRFSRRKKKQKPQRQVQKEKIGYGQKFAAGELDFDEVYKILLNGKREGAVYLGKIEERKGLTDVLLVASPWYEDRFHLRMFKPRYLDGKRLYMGDNFPIKMDSDKKDRYWHILVEKGFLDEIS